MTQKPTYEELEQRVLELEKSEEALKDSEERYRTIFSNSPVGIFRSTLEGRFLEVNPALARMLGYDSPEDVIKNICSISEQIYMYPEKRQQIVSEQLQSKDITCHVNRYRRKDGSEFIANLYLTTVRHVDKPVFIEGIVEDITERKLFEEALSESEARFRLLFERAPLGYQSLDENGFIIEINQTWLDTLGYSREEVIGKSFAEFLHPDWKEHFKKNFPLFKAVGEILGVEFEMVKKNGSYIHVSFNGKIVRDKNGNFQQTHCIFYDITDRKRIEEEQKRLEAQNRQLQKAESLGRMAGAIAHHFNNQLYAVMGNLEIAMEDLTGGADISATLSEAHKAVLKAAEVSRLMLTYLGQTTGKHKPIDLSDAYRQSLTLLQAAAPEGMILNADFPSSGPIINADAGQMQQILTNLVTNAWEATSDNRGTIGLSVKTVSHEDIPSSKRFPIDWQPQEIDYACLEVSDTGCGISNKDIEKIFDPFFTTKFTGRGLGLPVVMGIVKAHGGGVTVESEPGRGSVFRFFLPVSTEELPIQHDLPAISEALPSGKAEKISKIESGRTVLLIEDEDPVRNMTKKMLTRMGYTVLEAKDGAEAVDIFQKHQDEILCVLSDLTMPRMDGWETLAALRKLSPYIPVILSSGYDEAHVMAEEHTEIPNAFLGKPYRLQELRDTIRHILTNKNKSFTHVHNAEQTGPRQKGSEEVHNDQQE